MSTSVVSFYLLYDVPCSGVGLAAGGTSSWTSFPLFFALELLSSRCKIPFRPQRGFKD